MDVQRRRFESRLLLLVGAQVSVVRDLRVDVSRQIDLAGCLQKARVFGATPGIGTATFRVDGASNGELISTFRT